MSACPFHFKNWIHPRGVSLFVGIIGVCSFIAALVWQFLGAVPCPFCYMERTLMLIAGLACFGGLVWQCQSLYAGLLTSAFAWLAAIVVLMRHIGVQYHWAVLPQMCKADLPDNILEMEAFLQKKPQASCDQIEFLLLGLPPTFYLLGLCLICFSLCCWGFLREET